MENAALSRHCGCESATAAKENAAAQEREHEMEQTFATSVTGAASSRGTQTASADFNIVSAVL